MWTVTISAEIPDPVEDLRGYKLVTELMMHGPYGAANLGALSMQNGPCNKHFPKKYNDRTFFDSNGHMHVHLENMQRVTFCERDRLDIIVNLLEKKKTTLTEWFVYNKENTDGRHLTYLNFPSEFVWYPNSKQWNRRQIRTKKSLRRLIHVHPSLGDLFYFRMLLCHQKGCKSPVEVRTVNGHILPTNQAACEALRLLGDDKE
ncbi:hypothetical protein Tco_0597767 [Tanacetum coccineum]